MLHRIAMASTDGTVINQHFGQAERFYIYELSDTDYKFIDIRNKSAVTVHSEDEFDRVLKLIYDCDSIFVSCIGQGAARYLNSKGMRVFEAPYSVSAVLDKLIDKGIL